MKAVVNKAVKKARNAKAKAEVKEDAVKAEALKKEDSVSGGDQESDDDWVTAAAINSDDAGSDDDNHGTDGHDQDAGEMDGQDGGYSVSKAAEEGDDVTEVQTKTPSSRKRGSGSVPSSRKKQRGRKASRKSEASDDEFVVSEEDEDEDEDEGEKEKEDGSDDDDGGENLALAIQLSMDSKASKSRRKKEGGKAKPKAAQWERPYRLEGEIAEDEEEMEEWEREMELMVEGEDGVEEVLRPKGAVLQCEPSSAVLMPLLPFQKEWLAWALKQVSPGTASACCETQNRSLACVYSVGSTWFPSILPDVVHCRTIHWLHYSLRRTFFPSLSFVPLHVFSLVDHSVIVTLSFPSSLPPSFFRPTSHVCLHACLPARLPACVPACVPTCLPACRRKVQSVVAFWLTRWAWVKPFRPYRSSSQRPARPHPPFLNPSLHSSQPYLPQKPPPHSS